MRLVLYSNLLPVSCLQHSCGSRNYRHCVALRQQVNMSMTTEQSKKKRLGPLMMSLGCCTRAKAAYLWISPYVRSLMSLLLKPCQIPNRIKTLIINCQIIPEIFYHLECPIHHAFFRMEYLEGHARSGPVRQMVGY